MQTPRQSRAGPAGDESLLEGLGGRAEHPVGERERNLLGVIAVPGFAEQGVRHGGRAHNLNVAEARAVAGRNILVHLSHGAVHRRVAVFPATRPATSEPQFTQREGRLPSLARRFAAHLYMLWWPVRESYRIQIP
eukprot:3388117-Rhodomonas_salina.3